MIVDDVGDGDGRSNTRVNRRALSKQARPSVVTLQAQARKWGLEKLAAHFGKMRAAHPKKMKQGEVITRQWMGVKGNKLHEGLFVAHCVMWVQKGGCMPANAPLELRAEVDRVVRERAGRIVTVGCIRAAVKAAKAAAVDRKVKSEAVVVKEEEDSKN